MLIRLLRWLRGYVCFDIKGRFPERFMNICLKNGVFLFNAGPVPEGFQGSMLLSDYRRIRTLARKARVTLRIVERFGFPFFLSRYKDRKGLLAGAVCFFLITVFMQSFVWTIEINGIETLSETDIRKMLSENAVYEGALKIGKDFRGIERKIMEDTEEISWMSINVIGTKVEVEIKEKAQKPDIIKADIPCNIKAQRDGIILSMNVKQGSTVLTTGSAVIEGQILISGVIENSLEKNFLVHAEGDVIAQTTHSVIYEAKKTGVYNKPQKSVNRHNLKFFQLRIPLGISSVVGDYSSRVVCRKLFLNDTSVELGLSTEYCTLYEDYCYDLTDDMARKRLTAEDYLYRLFALKDCESISADISVSDNKDEYVEYVRYTCIEDIGKEEKIIVN